MKIILLIMQWLGLATGLSIPSASGRKTYEKLYKAGPSASNVEALGALFLDVRIGSCCQQQRRKPTS